MKKPKVICLCGSTRFHEVFDEKALSFTLCGMIVLSIGTHRPDCMVFAGATSAEGKKIKHELDVLHLRKIDLADAIYVINKDGYIGESTRREINYALQKDKPITSLEPIDWDAWEDQYVDPEGNW